jgi:hypothetical protein
MKMPKSGLVLGCLLALAFVLCSPGGLHRELGPGSLKRFNIPRFQPKIPSGPAFRNAMRFFNTNRSKIKNRQYLTIIDYTKPSHAERMFVINLKTGNVTKHLVAHGKNSGYAYAVTFSNEVDSLKSSKGFFLTGRKYSGKHGTSLTLHGLQRNVNDNALERGIVIHGSQYVCPAPARGKGRRVGRSWGCPAVPLTDVDQIVNKIKNGSLLYIHSSL